MSLYIRDSHLEEQVERERERRKDATRTKTASDLIREKLTEIETSGAYQPRPTDRTPELAVSSASPEKA